MKICYIIALVVVGLTACNKGGSDPAPSTTTNQNLLKTWKASQVLEGTLNITNEFGQYRLTLEETNGTKSFRLVQRDGTSLTGSWEISTDETTLTLTASGNTLTLSGVSISANELKYTTAEQGKTGTVNLNFTLVPA